MDVIPSKSVVWAFLKMTYSNNVYEDALVTKVSKNEVSWRRVLCHLPYLFFQPVCNRAS